MPKFTPGQQAANRETLKATLRSHAGQFHMDEWIEPRCNGRYPKTLKVLLPPGSQGAAIMIAGGTYQDWIDAKLATEDSWNKCVEWTTEMSEAFPELKRVRGHVYVIGVGERPHWWLKDPDGNAIDPTRQQFYDLPGEGKTAYYGGMGCAMYEELPEDFIEPIGKCPNCGGLIYPNEYSSDVCSEKCGIQYTAYLMKF